MGVPQHSSAKTSQEWNLFSETPFLNVDYAIRAPKYQVYSGQFFFLMEIENDYAKS
jgi:hypothetical protein